MNGPTCRYLPPPNRNNQPWPSGGKKHADDRRQRESPRGRQRRKRAIVEELTRRGTWVSSSADRPSRIALTASSADGRRTVHIQVKTKGPRSETWRWNLTRAESARHASARDYLILVDLAVEPPAYYIWLLRTVVEKALAWYDA